MEGIINCPANFFRRILWNLEVNVFVQDHNEMVVFVEKNFALNHFYANSNSFGFEMEIGTDGCGI